MELNKAKLKAMVHYVAQKAPARLLGKVKLNKILWFSDKEAYIRYGQTISGETYRRFQRGPVPRHLSEVIDELVQEDKIDFRKVREHKFIRFAYTSLKPMSPEEFELLTSAEISILHDHIMHICNEHTAESISDKSHDEVWRAFHEGDDIPFAACLSREAILSSDDLALAEKHSTLAEADMAWLNAQ